jgi:hypothetical protein
MRWFTALATCLLLSLGCGEDEEDLPATAPVSGTFTYEGKPVEVGTVTFYPQGGEGNHGIAIIQAGEEGKFTLTTYKTGDGAVLGSHIVTILYSPFPEDVMSGKETGKSLPPIYADPKTSPLKAEIKENKDNEFDFVLEDQ